MATSFRRNKKRNQFYSASEQSLWHFPLALLLSFCLMFLDRQDTIMPVHRLFASLVYPLQYIVDAPTRLITWSRMALGSKQALLDETRVLHEEQLYLKAGLQQFLALENENKLLKSMLFLSEKSEHQMAAARILAFETTEMRHVLIINKGKREGVVTGQLVLDTEGVTGQVIDVGFMTSTVLLISDSASAVPVRNQRTGETAILAGTNRQDKLALIYLPKTALVQKGDILATSGLGQSYPEGYPVGMVEAVGNLSGEEFIRVNVRPFTHYHRDGLLLLVWPDKKNTALKKEIKARLRQQGSTV